MFCWSVTRTIGTRRNVTIPFVKYHVTEDVATELKRYQAGEIDITYDIPLNQIETLKASMPDEVKISPSTEVIYYSFNLTDDVDAEHRPAPGADAGD